MHHKKGSRKGPDFSTYSLSHLMRMAVVEPAPSAELEAVIESPNAIDAGQMSRKGIEIRPRRLLEFCLVLYAASRFPSLTSFCVVVSDLCRNWGAASTHQSAHGSVQRMPMVPSELGVGSLERRITVRLGLLDTKLPTHQSFVHHDIEYLFASECGSSCRRLYRAHSGSSRGRGCIPVPVVLLRLVVLGRVL